jgi:hypothetical protein
LSNVAVSLPDGKAVALQFALLVHIASCVPFHVPFAARAVFAPIIEARATKPAQSARVHRICFMLDHLSSVVIQQHVLNQNIRRKPPH